MACAVSGDSRVFQMACLETSHGTRSRNATKRFQSRREKGTVQPKHRSRREQCTDRRHFYWKVSFSRRQVTSSPRASTSTALSFTGLPESSFSTRELASTLDGCKRVVPYATKSCRSPQKHLRRLSACLFLKPHFKKATSYVSCTRVYSGDEIATPSSSWPFLVTCVQLQVLT